MFAGDNALRMMGTERMAANGCQMPLVNTTDVHLQSLNTARFWLKGISECLAFQLLRAFVADCRIRTHLTFVYLGDFKLV